MPLEVNEPPCRLDPKFKKLLVHLVLGQEVLGELII